MIEPIDPTATPFESDDYSNLDGLDLPSLTDEQSERLTRYVDLVLETNRHTNLTGAKDFQTIWDRHILDSLYVTPLLQGHEQLIDIGSGGGFPAIPMAIFYQDLLVTMLESTGKKSRFLESCTESLSLPCARVFNERAERLGHSSKHRAHYDVVTARAVTALSALIELSVPFLKKGGRLLAMKGRRIEEEISAAENALDQLHAEITGFHTYEDSTGEEACIVAITKMDDTPRTYPRATGIPSTTPL